VSGPDLKRELARRRQAVPIVFITAEADEAVRAGLPAGDAAACLLKPFSDTALLHALNTALEGG